MKVGETKVKVIVHGPKASEEVTMLADTGASYSVIPKNLADRLGIEPIGETNAELADGSVRAVKFGRAEFQIESQKEWARVFIGFSDRCLLGATTLEMLGLKVNPVSQKLEPAEQYLLAIA